MNPKLFPESLNFNLKYLVFLWDSKTSLVLLFFKSITYTPGFCFSSKPVVVYAKVFDFFENI